jgi:hypothetical protein
MQKPMFRPENSAAAAYFFVDMILSLSLEPELPSSQRASGFD